jgi:hypothetical protein
VAIHPRTVHRPWIAFLTIAGAILAVAGATAHKMAGNGAPALANGLSRSGLGAAPSQSLGGDNRRLVTADRPARPADGRVCSRLSADRFVLPNSPAAKLGSQSGHRVRVSYPVRVESGTVARGGPPTRGLTLWPGKRPRLRFDADDWEDRGDEDDDDMEVPVGAWLREMVRCFHHLTPGQNETRFASPEISPRFPTRQRLRC